MLRLPQSYYRQNTLKVARGLLGKYLVRRIGNKKIVGQITETEAYCGPDDLASHASRGRTPRTEVMFGEPGYWYVYLIYGMYYCLNVVTEKKDYPAAVLIRSVMPASGLPANVKTDGPGKLCRAFQINESANTYSRLNHSPAFGPRAALWIEDRGVKLKTGSIKKVPRVGVDYAGEYRDKRWRFYIR